MSRQQSWFRALEASYHSAAAATVRHESRYGICGLPVRIVSAGRPAMEIVDRAIEHLRLPARPQSPSAASARASLTVLLFDGTGARVPVPPPPAPAGAFTARGDILGFDTARFKAAYQPFGRIISAFDAERALGICCFDAVDGVLSFERAAPLRSMLAWWACRNGRQLVHAALVGRAQGGLLLAGRGGSGKSNTALACLGTALGFGGDDFCAVATDGTPTAYSLYATARTRPRDWTRLPFLESLSHGPVGGGVDEKALYFLMPRYSRQMLRSAPIRAIVLPSVDGAPTSRLVAASPSAALMAIAPVTTTLLPGAGREVLTAVGALVKRVPAYALRLGTDVEQLQALLSGLLDRLEAGGGDTPPANGPDRSPR